MTVDARSDTTIKVGITSTLIIALSLTAVATALTVMFLVMRKVMELGGSCAEGGPFVTVRPCPDGVPGLIAGGVVVGLAAALVYAGSSVRRRIPSFVGLLWPALFLSLGWNFLEFGLDPPGGGDGPAWGWIVSAVVFGLMGAGPFFLGSPARWLRGHGARWSRNGAVTQLIPATLRPPPPSTNERPHATPKSGEGIVVSLERLAKLHRRGELSDAEFALAKQRLMDDEWGEG